MTLDEKRAYGEKCLKTARTAADIAGATALETGRIIFSAQENLGSRKEDLIAWLNTWERPLAISTAYAYVRFYRERRRLEEKGHDISQLSFRAARELLTERRPPLLPGDRKARNRREEQDLARELQNVESRCASLIDYILGHGEPRSQDVIYDACKRYVKEMDKRRQRGRAVREEK